MIIYQHRDLGCYFRKNKGVVERLSWCGTKWLSEPDMKTTEVDNWTYVRAVQ